MSEIYSPEKSIQTVTIIGYFTPSVNNHFSVVD